MKWLINKTFSPPSFEQLLDHQIDSRTSKTIDSKRIDSFCKYHIIHLLLFVAHKMAFNFALDDSQEAFSLQIILKNFNFTFRTSKTKYQSSCLNDVPEAMKTLDYLKDESVLPGETVNAKKQCQKSYSKNHFPYVTPKHPYEVTNINPLSFNKNATYTKKYVQPATILGSKKVATAKNIKHCGYFSGKRKNGAVPAK